MAVADAGLVAVHLSGVDVAVAGLEGRGHDAGGLVPGGTLKTPKPELRNGRAVVERDRGHGHAPTLVMPRVVARPGVARALPRADDPEINAEIKVGIGNNAPRDLR